MITSKTVSIAVLSVLAAIVIWPLAGCGGGGGGHSRSVVITGVVSDIEGNLVPNATVTISNSSGRAKTAFNGAYKLPAGSPGWQTIHATASIDGHTWRGSQAVQVFSDGPTLNVNIVIGQFDKLGSIAGRVRDSGGFGIDSVRVYVATTYGSAVALTNSSGDYRLDDMPASVTVGGVDKVVTYVMTASRLGFSNQTRDKTDGGQDITVDADATTTMDFVLTATTGTPVQIPNPWTIDVTAWTFPQNVSRSTSAYNAIRSKIDPSFTRALAKKAATRSPEPGSSIEIDVTWFESWNAFLLANFAGLPPDNLAGFAVYRRIGSAPTSASDRLYFDRQPLLTDFFDGSPELTSGLTYYYRITALNTNYLDTDGNFVPEAESDFSSSASATPLSQLHAITPGNNAVENRLAPIVFSWAPLGGAQSYMLFIYDRFPEMIDTGTTEPFPDQVVQPVSELETTGTNASDPNLVLIPGRTYYWVVIGANNNSFGSATAYSIGELRKFTVL